MNVGMPFMTSQSSRFLTDASGCSNCQRSRRAQELDDNINQQRTNNGIRTVVSMRVVEVFTE